MTTPSTTPLSLLFSFVSLASIVTAVRMSSLLPLNPMSSCSVSICSRSSCGMDMLIMVIVINFSSVLARMLLTKRLNIINIFRLLFPRNPASPGESDSGLAFFWRG